MSVLRFVFFLVFTTQVMSRNLLVCVESSSVLSYSRDRIVKVFGGLGTSFLLDSVGNIYPFGNNEKGELGIPRYDSYVSLSDMEVLTSLDGLGINKICSGYEFSAVLSSSGQVFTFGGNEYGNLGRSLSSEYYSYEPELVDFSELFIEEFITDISCGLGHVIALTSSGSVVGWGRNTELQLDPSSESRFSPVLLNYSDVENIFTGFYHTCVQSRNEIICFGDNTKGQMGVGSPENYVIKSNITDYLLHNFGAVHESFFTSGDNTFVVTMDGQLLGTGSNLVGELGTAEYLGTYSREFVEVIFTDFDPLDISKIENNHDFERPANLFLLATNELYSLGNRPCVDEYSSNSTFERVISGALTSDFSTSEVVILQSVACYSSSEELVFDTNEDVCSGDEAGVCEEYYECYCRPSYLSDNCNERVEMGVKSVFSTGINEFGSNADGTLETRDHDDIREVSRDGVLYGVNITSVSSGDDFQLFLSSDKQKLFSVGLGRDGQLGDGHTFDRVVAAGVVDESFDTVSVCSGRTESIGISSSGTLFGFGKATHGYFGSGIFSEYLVPTRIPVNDFLGRWEATSFACGGSHMFVILENGIVYGSGKNDLGQLGNSVDYEDHEYPFLIEGELGAMVEDSYLRYTPEKAEYLNEDQINEEKRIHFRRHLRIKSGYDHSCFVTIDRELYCWGSNEFGQLCNNSTFENTPILVSSDVIKFFVVGDSTFFVTDEEEDDELSLLSCGRNEEGQLGVGNTENQFSPQLVPFVEVDEIIDLQSSQSHSLLLLRSGSVFGSGKLTGYEGNERKRDEIDAEPTFTMISGGGVLTNLNVSSISVRNYGSSFVNGFYCFGFLESEEEYVCSGRGTCYETDKCDCDDGFIGTDCSVIVCFGVESGSESVCSSQGDCVYPDTCSCDPDLDFSVDEKCEEIVVALEDERPVTAEIVVLSTLCCLCMYYCCCCLSCILILREVWVKFGRKKRRSIKTDPEDQDVEDEELENIYVEDMVRE